MNRAYREYRKIMNEMSQGDALVAAFNKKTPWWPILAEGTTRASRALDALLLY